MIVKTKLVVGLIETHWLHQMLQGPGWPSHRGVSDRLHRLFVTLSILGRIGSNNSLVYNNPILAFISYIL